MTSEFHCNHTSQALVITILAPVMIVEILVGLPCNIIALWIFWKRIKGWWPNIIFLLNLVMADFLLLVSMPFRIDYLLRGEDWAFSGPFCCINLFMLSVNRSASIAFMTLVAADRYFKVVHPHHRINHMNPQQAWVVAFCTWVLVISLRVPLLTIPLMKKGENNRSLCRSFDSYKNPPPGMLVHYVVFIMEFLLPLMLLIFCSARIACILRQRNLDRERKVQRAIRTVLVIVVVFVVCFAPGVVTGLLALAYKTLQKGNCSSYQLMTQLFSLSIGFTYLNSALDPLVYCFSSSMFRNALKGSINQLGVIQLNLSRRGSMNSDG